MDPLSPKPRKGIIALAIIAVSLSLIFLGYRSYIRAQMATADAGVLAILQKAFNIDTPKKEITKTTFTTLLKTAAERYVNNTAKQVGFWLAGGNTGVPFKRTQSFKSILQNVGSQTAGEFLQELSSKSGLDKMGLNICNPTANIKLNASLSIIDGQVPRVDPNKCNFKQMADNWKRVAENVGYNATIVPSQAGFGGQVGQYNTNKLSVPAGVTKACVGWVGDPLGVQEMDFKKDKNGQIIPCTLDRDCPDPNNDKCMDAAEVNKQSIGGFQEFDKPTLTTLTAGESFEQKLGYINATFDPQSSDWGAFDALIQGKYRRELLNSESTKMSQEICQGFATDKAAGKVSDKWVDTTCTEINKGVLENTIPDIKQFTNEKFVENSTAGTFLNAARSFASSFLGAYLKNLIKSGRFSGSLKDLAGENKSTLTKLRENIIQQLNQGMLTPQSGTQFVTGGAATPQSPSMRTVDHFDYISGFSTCPDDRNDVGQNDCVIDEDFATAINEQLTVRQAIDQGLLNPSLPLISYLNVTLNEDPFCLRSGLCHSNIVKLRKYRVIPVGWEIAASLSSIDDPITIGEAVNCFDNGSACSRGSESNIYFHLVDPNWVLKAPEAQCRAQGNGPSLLAPDASSRQTICADVAQCIGEDDSGKCTQGFGYCTREKSIWRFDATSCPEQFASCSVVKQVSSKLEVNYLLNSVDDCSASDAGCRWYSTSMDNIGTVGAPDYQWNPRTRVYLNSQAKECKASDAGCSEYLSLATPDVNILPNGSFDYYTPSVTTDYTDPNWLDDLKEDEFTGWRSTGKVYTTGSGSYIGPTALRIEPTATGSLSMSVLVGSAADRTYTLSWNARTSNATGCSSTVSIGQPSGQVRTSNVTYSVGWTAYTMTVPFGPNEQDDSVVVTFDERCENSGAPQEWYMDGVSFSLTSASTGYQSYGEGGKVYLSSLKSCTAADVGCDRYTPVDGIGFPVPARASLNDVCPAECVGYQGYLELPNMYDALEASPAQPQNRSANFISSTANECPAVDIGCEEFTNLDEVAKGGEGRYAFSFVRQCAEDAKGTTFYTVEGSDTAGYQVKTWRLLPSNLVASGAPCTHINVAGDTCTDTAANTTFPTGDSNCSAGELTTNLDCREYFDIAGNPHYVKQSYVISASNDCASLRRTTTGTVFKGLISESRTCPNTSVNCREYRGNQGNNVRTLFSDLFETSPLAGWDTAAVSRSSEAVTNGGHSLVNINAQRMVSQPMVRTDTVAIQANREYYLEFWMKNPTPVTINAGLFEGATNLSFNTLTAVNGPWQSYKLGPLYVNQQSMTAAEVRLNLSLPSNTAQGVCSTDPTKTCTITNTSACPGAATCQPLVYLDNVTLRESISTSSLIKDSWRTPASCDTPVPGTMLGCRTYTNGSNTQVNLKSFSRLCEEDVVGCQVFLDTHNSSNPFSETFNSGDPAEITVLEDSLAYVVYQDKYRCSSALKGCTRLGEPQFNLSVEPTDNKYISGYAIKFLINDPDSYMTSLCKDDALFCEEFTKSDGSSVYFKDPKNRLCVYRTNVNIEGDLHTGWFQRDSLTGGVPKGCSDDGVLPRDQSDFALLSNLDYGYEGWAGECTAQYDQCTEFIDPYDTQGSNLLDDPEYNRLDPDQIPLGVLKPIGWGSHGISIDPTQIGREWTQAIDPLSLLWATDSARRHVKTSYGDKGHFAFGQFIPAGQITGSDLVLFSTEVRVEKLPQGPNTSVEIMPQCYWDSPEDLDYCRLSGSGAYDYARTCTTDADCAPNYVCEKFSWTTCYDATNQVMTGFPCATNLDCNGAAPRAALPSTYTCSGTAYDDSILIRDFVRDEHIQADPYLFDQWQQIQRTIDLSEQGRQKEFLGCTMWMMQYRGNYIASTCASGNSNDPLCMQTYCVDSSGKAATIPQTCFDDTTCPAAQSNCGGQSEVWWRSPVYRSAQSYYYIDNDDVNADVCSGQVSLMEGCVLFLDTNQRETKLYDSAMTYAKSTVNNGSRVSPEQSSYNDSNRIIAVKRDRQCSEWLACRSATEAFDPLSNSYRQVCDQIGTCTRAQPGTTGVLGCLQWSTPAPQLLEYGQYVMRSTEFSAADYTGYSSYNGYPAGSLELVDVSTKSTTRTGPVTPDPEHPDFRLVKVIDVCDSKTQYDESCPVTGLNQGIGRCYTPNKCIIAIDGTPYSRTNDNIVPITTRLYTELGAPVPYSVIQSTDGKVKETKYGFQNANVCDSPYESCEYRYYKLTYGKTSSQITRFISGDSKIVGSGAPTCICNGGDLDDFQCLASDYTGARVCANNTLLKCVTNIDCKADGTVECIDGPDGKLSPEERCPSNGSPVFLRRVDSIVNWPGYCLERDRRATINGDPKDKGCLSWLPIENTPTGFDFYNQDRSAGYAYKAPAFYCMEMGIYELRTEHRLGNFCDNNPPVANSTDYYIRRGERTNSCNSKCAIGGGNSGIGCHDQNTRYNYYEAPKGNCLYCKNNSTGAHSDCMTVDVDKDGILSDQERCGGTCSQFWGMTYCTMSIKWGPGDGLYLADPAGLYSRGSYREQAIPAQCRVFAKAVDEVGNNKAKTNFFWSEYAGGRGYEISTISVVLNETVGRRTSYNYDDGPFGSAVPTGFGFITDKLTVSGDPTTARAGTPYACINDSATCLQLNEDSGVKERAIKGFKKNPPYPGKEDYVIGVGRLKEIYAKIYGLYHWQQGIPCNYNVCGRTDDPAPGNLAGIQPSNYFGGSYCDPSEYNACNSIPNITSCKEVRSTCVNSLFNSNDPNSYFWRTCSVCPQAFTASTTDPLRKCYGTAPATVLQADCESADQDPIITGDQFCDSYDFSGSNYSCMDQGSGTYSCIGPRFSGNDCKIPYIENTTVPTTPTWFGPLAPEAKVNLLCVASATLGSKTCHYYGEDIEYPCVTDDDCRNDVDMDPLTDAGVVHEFNLNSYCADAYSEGAHDFGEGQFCVGEPFSSGYIFHTEQGRPVNCSGQFTYLNDLGESIKGPAICNNLGRCLPSSVVRDRTNIQMCEPLPDGYLSMCDPTVSSCASYTAENTIATSTMPFDTADLEAPKLAPYMMPVRCDDNGTNCVPVKKGSGLEITSLTQFTTSNVSGSINNDNGFSVNNIYSSSRSVIGYQSLLASLRFYMSADKQHMPIRFIEIEWGDGSKQSRVGYYKNYMPFCSQTADIGPNGDMLEFSQTTQACQEGFRSFLHVYQFDPAFLCPSEPNASCYTPRIMLQDNWGWCTNGVYGQTGIGCKDPNLFGAPRAPAPITTQSAYVNFAGVIKVYKDPQPR